MSREIVPDSAFAKDGHDLWRDLRFMVHERHGLVGGSIA
jgi:hypothetical protein